jgi:hypothetical protein
VEELADFAFGGAESFAAKRSGAIDLAERLAVAEFGCAQVALLFEAVK